MDFIKDMYEEGLVEKKLDEDAWADIRGRRIKRLDKGRRVALYGYLVGVDKAMRATKFADMAQDGKSVPSTFVNGYEPIVDMIEDIIDAGPGFISMLQNLHKRAKRSRK
jgi:hypothetical protein